MALYLDGFEVKIQHFPSGETRLELTQDMIDSIKNIDQLEITWNYKNDEEFFQLRLLTEKIRDLRGGEIDLYLTVPYFPHSRMDRTKEEYQTFSLKTVNYLLEEMGFDTILTYDLHSSVIYDKFNSPIKSVDNVRNLVSNYIREMGIQNSIILFPDKGAYDRYHKSMKPFTENFLVGEKSRDFNTGKIQDLSIDWVGEQSISPERFKDYHLLIVDDICSYGGTFDMALDVLSKKGFKFASTQPLSFLIWKSQF